MLTILSYIYIFFMGVATGHVAISLATSASGGQKIKWLDIIPQALLMVLLGPISVAYYGFRATKGFITARKVDKAIKNLTEQEMAEIMNSATSLEDVAEKVMSKAKEKQ